MGTSSLTRSSTPRLSERAKLVYPTGIVSTGWPEVQRRLAMLSIVFDWWQVDIAKLALAKRSDGLYAAGVGGVVLSIPRQIGKTFLLGGLVFALCLINPGTTALWTSHQLRTTKETLRAMQGLARRKAIAPFISAVRVANGEGEIVFANGSRILFGAREQGFGLGFADVDILVFDEGQRLTEKALDDMLPTQNRAQNPLFFVIGTPPRPTDSGEVFRRRRAEALSGTAEDMVFVEFSAGREASRDRIDWDQVARANPSFPAHTTRAAILRLWKNLGAASFRREGYGIWDDATGPTATIPAAKWQGRIDTAPVTDNSPVALGIKYSSDGKRVAAAACRRDADDNLHVEGLGCWPTVVGDALLTDLVAADWRRLAAVVIDGKAGAGALAVELGKRGVPSRKLILPTVADVHTAHTMMLTAVLDGSMTHANQAGLNAAVATATQRKIGTAGGWGWLAIGDGDVTSLDAATFALWAAATKAKATTGTSGWRVATG